MSTDSAVYDYILAHQSKNEDETVLRTTSWEGSKTTGQCIFLPVEHNGKYARILVKNKPGVSDFKSCPIAPEPKLVIEKEKRIEEIKRVHIIVPNCEEVKIRRAEMLEIVKVHSSQGRDTSKYYVPEIRRPPYCTDGEAYELETGKALPKGVMSSSKWVEETDFPKRPAL